ncbi:L,D-transpeptidase family protein [Paenibacillus naphthalenovorans]|uniref:ErfK/YbiS/YcfS/YnhG family protein n=1 Tax=Paenibacillus naphthalenovorans TaxID=162209 RepID=A0A0U2U3X6_9BACL|nr:L,D-transpeptidase [Paenibacillus naphthalenovorans]ALS21032.1 ErfK/YbiS/YcfS/YnhG family protein [Paenibacillus naphthalenovorans]
MLLKSKDPKDQLQLFFKQDPQYLKTYVKEHPNNKMAWYLLGREYEAQGKQGKALYCYAQAGEIYEAYENQKVNLPPEALEQIRGWGSTRKRRRRMGRLRLGLALLMLAAAVLFAPGAPSLPVYVTEKEVPLPEGVTPAQLQETKVYYITGGKTQERIGAALQSMLLEERISSFAILARGIPMGQTSWISWLRKPEVLLSVEAKQDASQQQINYHDAESCGCQPADPGKAEQIVAAWMSKQEQELVLKSAIAYYTKANGRAPEQLTELTASYPGNVLPGVTADMQGLFDRQKDEIAAETAEWVKQNGSPKASEAMPGAEGLTKPMKEPLRIVVDKSAHRLALVSGNLIVRSYAVGLGGDRTPEGTFAITEKVRNPNGKSNGEFGSRGMTLSDTLYAIHGTNRPSSIGKDESLGCIRMRKEDVEELFDMTPLGTPVTIGRGLLPAEESRSGSPFRLPLQTGETNPGKVYRWLN